MAVENFELVMLVDDGGNHAVGRDREEAIEDYEARHQPLADAEGIRYIKVTLNGVVLPKPVELAADMEEDDSDSEPTLSVK